MSTRRPVWIRRAHGLACALGVGLFATPAAAQFAGGEVANDVCEVASDRVNQLRDALRQRADAANYPGTGNTALCDDFVKQQVANCIEIVENGTDCRETLDKTEQKIQTSRCTEEETKADRKACERAAVVQQQENDEVANTLRVIGTNNCNGAFAAAMRQLCETGWPPPP
jgi:hypothetical protein